MWCISLHMSQTPQLSLQLFFQNSCEALRGFSPEPLLSDLNLPFQGQYGWVEWGDSSHARHLIVSVWDTQVPIEFHLLELPYQWTNQQCLAHDMHTSICFCMSILEMTGASHPVHVVASEHMACTYVVSQTFFEYGHHVLRFDQRLRQGEDQYGDVF